MVIEILNLHPDNGQRSYKSQIKYAERMILPGSSQNTHKCTFEYVGTEETDRQKSQISSSSSSF